MDQDEALGGKLFVCTICATPLPNNKGTFPSKDEHGWPFKCSASAGCRGAVCRACLCRLPADSQCPVCRADPRDDQPRPAGGYAALPAFSLDPVQ